MSPDDLQSRLSKLYPGYLDTLPNISSLSTNTAQDIDSDESWIEDESDDEDLEYDIAFQSDSDEEMDNSDSNDDADGQIWKAAVKRRNEFATTFDRRTFIAIRAIWRRPITRLIYKIDHLDECPDIFTCGCNTKYQIKKSTSSVSLLLILPVCLY